MRSKKSYIAQAALLAVTLVLAGCNGFIDNPGGQESVTDLPVGFSVYTLRPQQSKAGIPGEVTLTELQTGSMANTGFGVFAYHHNTHYDSHLAPDFMYNQQVTSSGANWAYNPVKYWPNTAGEMLSFFAYAPWVDVNEATGRVTDSSSDTGIMACSTHTATGDPLVSYVATPDLAKGVDLCWADATGLKDYGRPDVSEKVKLSFKHATAKLNVQIDAAVDATTVGTAVANSTKIYLRSITLKGFAMEGTLNLNSGAAADWTGVSTGNWLSHNAVTFYDGRLDGEEGISANESENPLGINPDLIQSKRFGVDLAKGINQFPKNVFKPDASLGDAAQLAQSMFVIPTGDPVSVQVEYDIETADELVTTLSDGYTPGISIPCKIKQTTITGLGALEAGKAYRLLLHVGLNSVKFDALVADWNIHDEEQDFMMVASIEVWLDGGELDVTEHQD